MIVIYPGLFFQEEEKELASTVIYGEPEERMAMHENSNWVQRITEVQDDEKIVMVFERG